MKPLSWLKDWLSQPDEFWKSMNHFNEECDRIASEKVDEQSKVMDMEDALKLAEELYGQKS